MLTEQQMKEQIARLPLDELVGQVLNFEFNEHRHKKEWMEQVVRDTLPGSICYDNCSDEFSAWVRGIAEKYCRIPMMYVGDGEHGPGCGAPNEPVLPKPMAWGAADEPEVVERAHRISAQLCRKHYRHLLLGPVVDINYNYNNCVVNVRAISDDPDVVARNAAAAVRGMQQDNLVAACCKHFPGDGIDQRNAHFMTSINTMSQEEWMNTYGRVYKAVIEAGTMSIMIAHVALPAFDEKVDDILGYPPATLSKNLMTGLLKEKLGFQGCIVSDAMCMIGACAVVETERLAVEYLKAGGDMVLYALPSDFDYIKAAVQSGDLPMERLQDAVLRIWRMKNAVGLFGEAEQIHAKLETEPIEDINQWGRELAEHSVTVIRNAKGLFPQRDLKPGSKVLQVVIQHDVDEKHAADQMRFVENELRVHGMEVTTLVNPKHYDVKDAAEKYDVALLNININPGNYQGGTLRIGWNQAMALWRGYLMRHPKLIITSFGDPYKLYDYPFARTYINMYSPTEDSQRAFVRALLGEIEAVGKSPVAFEGFFERGV